MLTIHKPTLLLNQERVLHNIETMVNRAKRSKVRFRPHFKTHQSAEIGQWFKAAGVEAITVSSLSMGRYFAQHGWSDITVAFPANILEIETINELARQINLGLLVESEETVRYLAQHVTAGLDLWIKVDTGYGRTGVNWVDADLLDALATQINSAGQLRLRGILTHSGHSYRARSKAEIEVTYQDTLFKMKAARARLEMAGVDRVEISIGDTPSCSVVDNLGEVDEIRPGNFVFYDVMQLQIGACREEDIAVALACPVVATHPKENKVVVYGGAVHLSTEFLEGDEGQRMYGAVALPATTGWGACLPGAYLARLSQEHGVIRADESLVNRLKVGDIVMILPVHSCLTANLMKKYQTLAGDLIPLGE